MDLTDSPDVVCAMVQSLRGTRLRRFPPNFFHTIIIDEADLGIAPSYLQVCGHFDQAKIAGFTATPDRADGKPLSRLFQSVAGVVEIADLIREGYLCRIVQAPILVERVELDRVEIDAKRGDFSSEALGRVLVQERPLHAVVRPALDEAEARPTIVFAATTVHADALAAVFNRYRAGCARAIHTKSGEEDGPTVEAFQRREFQFLVNVAKLTRGIDLPLTSCVVMARPTLSRPLYAQMVGRGTRLADGKTDLLVLDFAGNAGRHCLITVVDILGGKYTEEARELARERLEDGGDTLVALDEAEEDLRADPVLLDRVRAKVAYRALNVSPFARKGIDWDSVGLGTDFDLAIARRVGVSVTTVNRARIARGIPRFVPVDWPTVDLSRPTVDLVNELGVSATVIKNKRRQFGVSAPPRAKPAAWWADLGKCSDREVAQRHGVSASAVYMRRRSLGITAAHPKRSPANQYTAARSRTDAD